MFDVDIDFADRNVLLEKLKHRIAKLGNGKKHNTGVYFTEIPHDPATNLSTLDYETAEDRNYFKLDCLNVSIYKDVKDNDHLNKLMTTEPMWELLEAKEFSDQVFHLNGHNEILKTYAFTRFYFYEVKEKIFFHNNITNEITNIISFHTEKE